MNNEALVTETRRTGTDPTHISPHAVVFHTVCSNINLDQVAQLVQCYYIQLPSWLLTDMAEI